MNMKTINELLLNNAGFAFSKDEELNKHLKEISNELQSVASELQVLKSADIIDGMKVACIGEIYIGRSVGCPECNGVGYDYEADDCSLCGGDGYQIYNEPVDWSTMKDVYKLMHETKVKLLSNN